MVKNKDLMNYGFVVDGYLGELAVGLEELEDVYDVLNYTMLQLEKFENQMKVVSFHEYKQLKVMRSALNQTLVRFSRIFEDMSEENEKVVCMEVNVSNNNDVGLKRFIDILEQNMI